jgi:hypothetical protein
LHSLISSKFAGTRPYERCSQSTERTRLKFGLKIVLCYRPPPPIVLFGMTCRRPPVAASRDCHAGVSTTRRPYTAFLSSDSIRTSWPGSGHGRSGAKQGNMNRDQLDMHVHSGACYTALPRGYEGIIRDTNRHKHAPDNGRQIEGTGRIVSRLLQYLLVC